jgi:hypothetical protein
LSDWVPLPDAGEDELVPEVVPELVPEVLAPVDWLVLVPWFIVEDDPVEVADWLALTPLSTVWLPLPMFTPGLTLAPRFTSVLLMPTFASTPTFGFTLSEEVLLLGVDEELVLLGLDEDELLLPGLEMLPLDVEPDVPLEIAPEALPELVLPVAPFDGLLVLDVPMRSLPPEIAVLLDEVPLVAAFVP